MEGTVIEGDKKVECQLYGFCDEAFSCLMYLSHFINGRLCVVFVLNKTDVALVNQTNLIILQKELVAVEICRKLMQDVSDRCGTSVAVFISG